MIYTDLQTERMLTVLDQVSAQTNSTQQTIEKDWWVTQWRKDYETMQRTMIYGQSVTFDELLAEIRQLNIRIRELPYQK